MVGRLSLNRILGAAAIGLLLLSVWGCRLMPGGTLETPDLADQRSEILRVVSLGADRQTVVSTLLEAGVAGSFGYDKSVYYCDLWKREDGARWHLNVALYFDESGRLYSVGNGQAETGVLNDAAGATPAGELQAIPLPVTQGESQPERGGDANPRTGRRTPFVDPEDLR